VSAGGIVAALVAAFAIAGCTAAPSPVVTLEPGVPIDCGPIVDRQDCVDAATMAATAKINPPPIVRIQIRRPAAGDDCLTGLHPCDAEDVIVEIQSGDTIQDVALTRSGDRWLRIDLIR
jgi:hypothetical protein